MRGRHLRHIATLATAVLALATLSACTGYDGVVNRGAVVDSRKVAQVKPGTPAQAALAALGSPSTTSTIGGDAWYYVSQRTERRLAFMNPQIVDQHVLALYFDRDKKVQRIADYGLEDGKVIDFQSRTTPVAGGDATFIRSLLSSAGSMAGNLWPFSH